MVDYIMLMIMVIVVYLHWMGMEFLALDFIL